MPTIFKFSFWCTSGYENYLYCCPGRKYFGDCWRNFKKCAYRFLKARRFSYFRIALKWCIITASKENGINVFLHPIQSFSKSSSLAHQLDQMQQCVYGFEGEKAAIPIARQLVKSLQGVFVTIPKEEKFLYHIASVFASNYSVALLGVVDDVVKRIGGELTLAHFKPLVRTSIENAFQQTPVQALTGPIARGSFASVKISCRSFRTSIHRWLYYIRTSDCRH